MARGSKAPFIATMDGGRVRDAFRYITSVKDELIIKENGKIVDIKEAVRRFKQTGDDKWVLHVLASNLGYFATALSKIVAKWNIDPADYIPEVFEGLRKAMSRADENIVKLSYLSTGVYMWCRKQAELEVRERSKQGKLDEIVYDIEDDELIGDLDTIMASQGIYLVPLEDGEDSEE